MSDKCPKVDRCPLFPELRHTLDVWRMVYCEDRNEGWKRCERFMRSERGEDVPLLLLPNGKLLER